MTNTATRSQNADTSVLPGVRGLPSWAVVLLALVLTLGGAAVDGLTTGVLSWGLRIGFYLGVVLAVLLVKRGSVFTAMVQPPLVLVVGVVLGGMLFTGSGGLYSTGLKLIAAFPTMALGTAVAVLIGLIRILAQPMRGNRQPGRMPPSHA